MTIRAYVVERATVLSEHVELLSQGRKRPAVHAMRVSSAFNIRARSMNG